MKKLLLLLLITAFFTASASAQKVTLNESIDASDSFINSTKQSYRVQYTELIKYKGELVMYMHGLQPKGFVLSAATKSVKPIIAYSRKGHYPSQKNNPAFEAWISQYKKEIAHAISTQLNATPKIELEWEALLNNTYSNKSKSVAPMLVSQWDQGQFYNQLCPVDPMGPAGHCYTGCVATAMGQLCYYYRWPDCGEGAYTYQHPSYGTIAANFQESYYRWNEMSNSLMQENSAVAELLFHLGVSVDMDYGPNGSGMWNHKAAYSLGTHFKFNPETDYLYRDSTNIDWDSTIVAHLDAGVPMYYAGWSVPNVNGHAFIVDGYENDDYFHFNWGWGGAYDGYFYLDALNPGGSNFNLAQELVINCWPDTANYQYPIFCTGADTLTSLTGTLGDGSGPMFKYQHNQSCSWLIDPQTAEDSVTSITLQFDQFNTIEGQDILKVYDGGDAGAVLLGSFSGDAIPESITSNGNKLFITFETDEADNAAGWLLSYSCETPVWCNGMSIFDEPTGEFSDGSGSFNYQSGSTCMWLIAPEMANKITLSFSAFETEEGQDKVKIYNADNNELLATFSGDYEPGNLPEPVVCLCSSIMLTFSSDFTTNFDGWEAFYEAEMVGVEETLTHGKLMVSPNPARDYLNVLLPEGTQEPLGIQVFNAFGEIVFFSSESPTDGNLMIETGNYSRGIYFVKVKSQGMEWMEKIVLQ